MKETGIRAAVVNLGCAKNRVDSEAMVARLAKAGVEVSDAFPVDAVIINTCGFIGDAKEESLEEIFRFLEMRAEGLVKKVLVGGCLSQRYMEELTSEIPEVDLFFGLSEIPRIDALLFRVLGREDIHRISLPYVPVDELYRERAKMVRGGWTYLKITEGCSNNCTYCSIPLIRGPVKSRGVESIVSEFGELLVRRVREVNLVGQDIAVFGKETSPPTSLPALLERIASLSPGKVWIRLLYLHPAHVTDDLIDAVARIPQVVPYFDIPIQHASDRILERMNRRYSKKDLLELVSKVRERVEGAVLRTTVLVGFPGEGEKDFDELLEFMEQVEFDRLGGFAFSREEGTRAFEFEGSVPEEEARRRFEEVMTLQAEISLRRNRKLLGSEFDVLVEQGGDGAYEGRYYGQAPEVDGVVKFPSQKEFAPGDFVKVMISGFDHYDLSGELLSGPVVP